MNKAAVCVCAIVLVLSSFGSAYGDLTWNVPPIALEWGSGQTDQDALGLIWWLDPQTLLVLGFMKQEISIGPGPGAGFAVQSGTISETQTTETGTQSTSITISQLSYASGNGDAWVRSEAVVMTSQSSP